MLRSQHLNELHSVRLITLQCCVCANKPANQQTVVNQHKARTCRLEYLHARRLLYTRGDFVALSVGCELTFEAGVGARSRKIPGRTTPFFTLPKL